jgi:hypothetical protein
MHTVAGQRIPTIVAVLTLAAAASQCTSRPEATVEQAPPSPLAPVLTVQELMEHIIDPQADYVFNAVSVDVGPKGAVETKPTTDEDWTRIERGAWVLAEASNLLKISRTMAPEHVKRPGGPGAPELAPHEIEAKVKANPRLWASHADLLRAEALKVIEIVKARDADKLFSAGSELDTACEGCHLDFWYPGDRKAVLDNRNSTTYVDKSRDPRNQKK